MHPMSAVQNDLESKGFGRVDGEEEEHFENTLDQNKPVVFARFSKSAGGALVKALKSSSLKLAPELSLDSKPKSQRKWLLQSLAEAAEKTDSDTLPVAPLKVDLQAVEERLWRKRDKSDWDEYVASETAKGINTFQLEWSVPEFFPRILDEFDVFTCMRVPFRRIEAEFCREQSHLFTFENGEYVPSPKPGQTCSSWMQETLYWKSDDDSEAFKVSVNKSNYHVRFLCGLSADPLTDVTNSHKGYLEKAKRRLERFVGIVILNDVDTYSLLRRWHYYERLKRVNIPRRKCREDLFDLSRDEFEEQNQLDYKLFEYAKQLSSQRLSRETLNRHLSHERTSTQDQVMAQTDIIVPIKTRGILLRTVLEALDSLYKPRSLVILTAGSEIEWIQGEVRKWKLETAIKIYDEDDILVPLGVTRTDLEAVYESGTVGHTTTAFSVEIREFGWWFQQILKLGVGLAIPEISEDYYVWDADLIPLTRWKLGDLDEFGKKKFYTAVLQYSSRSGNAAEYAKCLKHTTDLNVFKPEGGGTAVTHHMAFNKSTLREMLLLITSNVVARKLAFPVDCKGLWPLAIMGLTQRYPRFSEYLTYASYCAAKGEFHYHKFEKFGLNAIRLRKDTGFLTKFLKNDAALALNPSYASGFSYNQFKFFSEQYYEHSVLPTVIQLDHVYTNLPEPSQTFWNYEEHYTYRFGVKSKSYEESRLAKVKVQERMKFWWRMFERQGTLFIHIPRNAGSSIEAILLANDEVRASQHFTAMEYRDSNYKLFQKLMKFCTVRNPYDRVLSAWSYLRGGGNQKAGDKEWEAHLEGIGTFQDFVEYYFKDNTFDWTTYKLHVHFVPQTKFITNEEGELMVEVCIEFEDFKRLGLRKLSHDGVSEDLVTQPPPQVRSSQRASVAAAYDEHTAEMIYSVYEDDFELLGYSKDSWH